MKVYISQSHASSFLKSNHSDKLFKTQKGSEKIRDFQKGFSGQNTL